MKPTAFESILIFTDGACTGNPGPGGWAAILVSPKGKVKELGGKSAQTTNNRMELSGAIHALQAIHKTDTDIVLYTDSTYVIRGITQWVWGWRKRGWRNAEGQEVSNRDMWEELSHQVSRLKPATVSWKYSRGHSGIPGNERCDEIAVAFAKGKWVELYDGPLLGYQVAIHDLPEDQELPEIKPKGEPKAPAFSYLSLHGGKIMRHKTWAECERRVKGQSGAKFKKAKSAADEFEIIKSWGYDPDKAPILE